TIAEFGRQLREVEAGTQVKPGPGRSGTSGHVIRPRSGGSAPCACLRAAVRAPAREGARRSIALIPPLGGAFEVAHGIAGSAVNDVPLLARVADLASETAAGHLHVLADPLVGIGSGDFGVGPRVGTTSSAGGADDAAADWASTPAAAGSATTGRASRRMSAVLACAGRRCMSFDPG